jgi:hypothetical protein
MRRRWGHGETIVALELKWVFGLPVVYYALRRLPAVHSSFFAIAAPEGRRARRNRLAVAAVVTE